MRIYLGAVALAASIGLAGAALAHEYKDGDVKIAHPHASPTPAGAKTGAAYMQVVNNGKTDLEIKSMSSPVADKIEVHSMKMDGGIARMRPMETPLKIAPGATLDLTGDNHIMLIGLKKPLAEEDMVSFKIEFANGKTMTFDLYVEEHHAPSSSGHEDHGEHDH